MPAWTLAVYSCKPRVYTLLMYKCVSILYILACLSDWCVWEGGRYLAPPLGVVNFFYCASFQQLFAYFYRPKTTGPSTHITVYIFYKFGPSLGSISQSVLSHLVALLPLL